MSHGNARMMADTTLSMYGTVRYADFQFPGLVSVFQIEVRQGLYDKVYAACGRDGGNINKDPRLI